MRHTQSTYLSSLLRAKAENWKRPAVLTMFPKFGYLPKEIRIKIWTYTVTPRIVPIRCRLIRSSREAEIEDEIFQSNFEYLSRCSLPSLFQICQEARGEGFRIYQQIFSTYHSSTGILHNQFLDTIYLSWSEFRFAVRETIPRISMIPNLIATVPARDIEGLKYLAIDIEIWCNAWPTTNEGRKVSRFESLKELTIVYDGGQLPRGPLVEEDIDISSEAPETPFWLNHLHAVIKARLEEEKGRFPDWEIPQWKLKKLRVRPNI